MKTIRAKDNHPTMKKLERIFDLANELGIRIDMCGHTTVVDDGKETWRLVDIEDDGYHDSTVKVIPPASEFKLVKGFREI